MRVRVKICGLTSGSGVRAAVRSGADAIGFVFSPSPRQVTIDEAIRLAVDVPPFVTTVAVFRHPTLDLVQEVLDRFRPAMIQTEMTEELSSALTGRRGVLPVVHDRHDVVAVVRSIFARHQTTVLLEASGQGGRGRAPDWDRAKEIAGLTPLVLAGGLNPENVGEAVAHVRPHAVDVSTGVEVDPGEKDPQKIEAFIENVRAAE